MGVAEDPKELVVAKRTAADETSQNNAGYLRSVQKAKRHLSVCLKLLGIMYRNDECADMPPSDDRYSAWPGEARGDKLYLAMVMLNSALLKALHVADSFQLHCQREFPKVASSQEDNGELGAVDGPRILEDGRIRGEDYRRLQAECLVHLETAWSLEEQRDNDKARIRQLEEEIRQLRNKVKKSKPATPPPEIRAKPEPPEVAQLRDDGLGLEWRPDGTAFVPDDELQRFTSIYQGLSQTVDEARGEAAAAKQRADDAVKRATEARKEREDLQSLLECGHNDLLDAARQIMVNLQHEEALQKRRKEKEQRASAMLAQLQELKLQDVALEQQCHDLSLENSRLQEAMAVGHRYTSSRGESLEAPPSAPRGSGIVARQRGRETAPRHAHREAELVQVPLGPDNQEADIVTVDVESAPRQPGRGSRSGVGRSSTKPFVVGSSTKSHHSAAHGGSHRKRREEPQSQDRLFAKAVLRYAKNPGDAQALGKLTSLLQGGRNSHMGDIRLGEQSTDSQDWQQGRTDTTTGFGNSAAADDVMQGNVSQGESRHAARSPSPPSAVGQDAASHRVASLPLGKVRGVQLPYSAQNLSSRAFATPERQRRQ